MQWVYASFKKSGNLQVGARSIMVLFVGARAFVSNFVRHKWVIFLIYETPLQ